jgi:hypothetical protein
MSYPQLYKDELLKAIGNRESEMLKLQATVSILRSYMGRSAVPQAEAGFPVPIEWVLKYSSGLTW